VVSIALGCGHDSAPRGNGSDDAAASTSEGQATGHDDDGLDDDAGSAADGEGGTRRRTRTTRCSWISIAVAPSFEWYATQSDCTHELVTERRIFTTQ
jgi:hypothetical protein